MESKRRPWQSENKGFNNVQRFPIDYSKCSKAYKSGMCKISALNTNIIASTYIIHLTSWWVVWTFWFIAQSRVTWFFRNHCCSRNIYYNYQFWKQLSCLIFLRKRCSLFSGFFDEYKCFNLFLNRNYDLEKIGCHKIMWKYFVITGLTHSVQWCQTINCG